jgi:bifunctional non-homologous end joining protein LigD
MQNREGKTVVAPYSPRAKPGATVSTPLTWPEVKRVPDPRAYTIVSVPERVRRRGDLFRAVQEQPQTLETILTRL